MSSSRGEQHHPSSLAAANADPPVAVDAKLMVATDPEEFQQMKGLVNKEDATAMVVVMASSNNQASLTAASPVLVPMHPLLLAAACSGDWNGLNFLLDREEVRADPSVNMPTGEFLKHLQAYNPGNSTNNGSSSSQPADDIEGATANMMPPSLPDSPESLLRGTLNGDTALHVVASHGDDDNFLKCVDIVYRKGNHLLRQRNNTGDTPLHCAARAGNSRMVSQLIDLAIDFGRNERDTERSVRDFLRMENDYKETALHEAIRIGDNHMVELLMTYDPNLAEVPDKGTSPLYLSILLEKDDIARTLIDMTVASGKGNNLSYFGPDGQNALHVAVLRSQDLTTKLLDWNLSLTTQGDNNGSTPLHFASSRTAEDSRLFDQLRRVRWFRINRNLAGCIHWFPYYEVLMEVLDANGAALYQPDNRGMFPIHVAAAVNDQRTVKTFIDKYRSSAGLRDKRGRTFLHVAAENKSVSVVRYACTDTSLAWVLNMQDNDGNTALHLAVEAANLRMFCCLFGNLQVKLNLVNARGQTPQDISHNKIPADIYYAQNAEILIRQALRSAGAINGSSRRDYFIENYNIIHRLTSDGPRKELKNVKESTQSLIIGAVLIATVTFGAAFTVPGGYRADDHTNGGTPTLAGRYAFDAFVIADTFAFVLSSISTVCLGYSGSPIINSLSRKYFLSIGFYFLSTSITCLVAAFTLGLYVVLAPVAPRTAITVCVISPLVMLCQGMADWRKMLILAPSYSVRVGPFMTCVYGAYITVVHTVLEYWPIIFTFVWAAYSSSHPASHMESTAQAPAHLT